MRIRTILAAAAAPAALAAVLLGTAGQASASVQQGTVIAHVHENGVTDTTNVPTGTDSPGGPVWAYDSLERTVTAVPGAAAGQWLVTVASTGSFNGFANPIDGSAVTGGLSGSVKGTITFTVNAGNAAPDAKLVHGQADPSLHSSQLATSLWKDGVATVDYSQPSPYTFTYSPIPVPASPAYPNGKFGITWGLGPNGMGYQQAG